MSNVQRKPRKLVGKNPSEREVEAALGKFEQLTERQQAIVFDELLRGGIEELWSRAKLVSEFNIFSPTSNPLFYGPRALDGLHSLVGNWLRSQERTACVRKSEEQLKADRAKFYEKPNRLDSE